MSNCLIICGSKEDYQVSSVSHHLRTLKIPYKIVDPYVETYICLDHQNDSLTINGTAVTPFAVWGQFKGISHLYGFTKEWAEKRSWDAEWQGILFNLYTYYDTMCYNRLHSRTFEARKLWQLALAKKVGFIAPESIVTNDPGQLKKYFSVKERVLVKGIGFVSIPIVRKPSVVESFSPMAELYDKEHMLQALSDNHSPPMLMQQYVKRKFDLRVMVIGDQVHAARICTPSGMVDSRRLGVNQKFEFVQVSEVIKRKLLDFMAGAKLSFGHFDFLLREDGEWVFLECNPEGVWAFYDEADQRISEAYARFFQVVFNA